MQKDLNREKLTHVAYFNRAPLSITTANMDHMSEVSKQYVDFVFFFLVAAFEYTIISGLLAAI